jgi:hypothetical protein
LTPPPAKRAPAPRPAPRPAATPARSRLVITIAAPNDCLEVQTLTLRDTFEANPGETEVRFHTAGKVLVLPVRVHVGPALLKGLRGAAGPSWKWDVVSVEPKRTAPPAARRSA